MQSVKKNGLVRCVVVQCSFPFSLISFLIIKNTVGFVALTYPMDVLTQQITYKKPTDLKIIGEETKFWILVSIKNLSHLFSLPLLFLSSSSHNIISNQLLDSKSRQITQKTVLHCKIRGAQKFYLVSKAWQSPFIFIGTAFCLGISVQSLSLEFCVMGIAPPTTSALWLKLSILYRSNVANFL